MLKELERPRHGWRLAVYSLSGRLLLLTTLFVMLSVALIYFPSVARYHHQLLQDRINSAQLAILPFTEAPGEQLSPELRKQLLARAGVEAVILRGGGQHELFLVGPDPPPIQAVYTRTITQPLWGARLNSGFVRRHVGNEVMNELGCSPV